MESRGELRRLEGRRAREVEKGGELLGGIGKKSWKEGRRAGRRGRELERGREGELERGREGELERGRE